MDLGKSGPGWKEVEKRTFVAATAGGRGGMVKVRLIECEAGYGGAKVCVCSACASANRGFEAVSSNGRLSGDGERTSQCLTSATRRDIRSLLSLALVPQLP